MAQLAVRVDPAQVRPRRPLGIVVEVLQDGAEWGFMDVRSYLIIRCPELAYDDAVSIFLAHRNTPDEDPDPATVRTRRIDPARVPQAVKDRVRAYLERRDAVAADVAALAREKFRAAVAQHLGRGLNAEERSLRTMQLLQRFRGKPRVYDRFLAAHREEYSARMRAALADLPAPHPIDLTLAQLQAVSEVIDV